MKTSKVKTITQNGTWEGNYGIMYKFEIEFDNGDVGEYSSKAKDQTKFIAGQEANYEYTGGKFPKVKPFYAPPQSNGQSFNYKKDDSVMKAVEVNFLGKASIAPDLLAKSFIPLERLLIKSDLA